MKKKIILLLFLIILVISLLYIFRKNISNKLFPIYKVRNRTEAVEKFKKKHPKERVGGWLKVQGTNIDYPIVINDKAYSYTTVNRDYDYVWVNNKINNKYNYIPIYGHNIRNVSKSPIIGDKDMNKFEQLMAYYYFEFNKDNKYFQVTMNNKNYLYQIFSVGFVSNNDSIYESKKFNNKEFTDYVNNSVNESLYKYNVRINKDDHIISLITCTRINGTKEFNFKVDGKLVKNKNVGYNYSINKDRKVNVVGGKKNDA